MNTLTLCLALSCTYYLCFCYPVTKSCLTLCNPMNCSTSGFLVLDYLLDFAQSHVLWMGGAIKPSHPLTPLSSCPQSLPASGSFPVSCLIASGGQRILTSVLVSVLPVNIQGPFHLGLTGLISLQSKGLSRVCSRIIWKHQIFSTQPSLWSNSHIYTWLLEKS